MNLAEFVSAAEERELELNIPLVLPAGGAAAAEPCPSLCVCTCQIVYKTFFFCFRYDLPVYGFFFLAFLFICLSIGKFYSFFTPLSFLLLLL